MGADSLQISKEKRRAAGIFDYLALALSTCGVGYIPGAPGTYGSLVGLGIYLFIGMHLALAAEHGLSVGSGASHIVSFHFALVAVTFALSRFWRSGRLVVRLKYSAPTIRTKLWLMR